MKQRIYYILVLVLTLTSCSVTTQIRKSDRVFNQGAYFEAANRYRKIYAAIPSSRKYLRGRVAFKVGESCRLCNQSVRAEGAYRNAIRYMYGDSIVLLRYAETLHKNGKYKQALHYYERYFNYNPASAETRYAIEACQQAQSWKQNPTRYKVRRSTVFNSRRADYCPQYLNKEEDVVIYTSTNDKVIGKKMSKITGMKNADLFFSQKNEKGRWSKPEPLKGIVNSSYDEGVATIGADGRSIYFTYCTTSPVTDKTAEAYTSQKSGDEWANPQKLALVPDSTIMQAHPVVTPSDDYVYFVSDMAGGMGGKDIWRVAKKGMEFGEPENLGPPINTAGDECFPYFRGDGTLYFSSTGHPGMGGLDLFKAVVGPYGNWEVTSMGVPMNSSYDDFGITFSSQAERGLFSSNRGDPRGIDHIWEFDCPEVFTYIEGSVASSIGDPLQSSQLRVVGNKGTNERVMILRDGSYKVRIKEGERCVLQASCNGYLNATDSLWAENIYESATYTVDFALGSIKQPVPLDNLFFEFGQTNFTPSSRPALDKLARMLKDNPNVTIALTTHTDRVGGDAMNHILSQRRAQAVVDYLIGVGITKDRLKAIGKGESDPFVPISNTVKQYRFLKAGVALSSDFIDALPPDQQEIAHSLNRRSEFQVISTTYGLY